MPLKLIPPGRRKANPHYLVRGRFIDGNDYEVSTETKDPLAAQKFKVEFERRLLEGRLPGRGEAVSFRRAAELYKAGRTLFKDDEKRIDRLLAVIGDKDVREVGTADLVEAAALICPKVAPQTQNRYVYTPGAAVMHYAAENGWCEWKKFKRPKSDEPETRAAAEGVGEKLLSKADGKQRLLILWLFKHGTRITNSLQVECERIDLKARTYELRVAKSRKWKTFPIDDEVWFLLANDADVIAAKGRLFPWTDRWQVYRWLIPLREALGVTFTPHMGRHRLGKELNAAGAGLKTIMGALGQNDPRSAARYAAEDVEVIRAATAKLGKKLGKTGTSN